jgi:hypothetical protein
MQVAQSAETTNFGTSIEKNEELSVQVWVWDGYWMPAELVTIFPDSDRRRFGPVQKWRHRAGRSHERYYA